MPKAKTKKSAAKRFKLTASGKVKFKKSRKRHLLINKPTDAKNQARQGGYLTKGDAKLIKNCLPNHL